MATETVSLGTDPGGVQFWCGGLGAFFKFGAAPAAITALLDIYSGSQYMRMSLNTDMTVLFELQASGWSVPNLTSAALTTGVWYWISGSAAPDGSQRTISELYIHAGSGVVSHPTAYGGVDHSPRTDITGIFGIGVALSSAYLGIPNAPGWAWSKPRVVTSSNGAYSPGGLKGGAFAEISSDWTVGAVGNNGGAWNCREATGSNGNLADVSSNNHPLIPAGQGSLVILDGPYP